MANPVIIVSEPDSKSRGEAVANVAEVPRWGTGGVSEMDCRRAEGVEQKLPNPNIQHQIP